MRRTRERDVCYARPLFPDTVPDELGRTMGSMTKEDLEPKLTRFLPPGVRLHEEASRNCLRAFVHPTANDGWNMDVPAVFGDSHWKSAVSYVLERRFPAKTKSEAKDRLNALSTNEKMQTILREVMDLGEGVVYGASYQHAAKDRSTHGQGTVLEAIVDGVMVSYGPAVCFEFVENIVIAYKEQKDVNIEQLEVPNAIGTLQERVSQHLGAPQHYLRWEFSDPVLIDSEQPAKGTEFSCKAAILGAPPGHAVGPLHGKKKIDAKKRAAEALLADETLQQWMLTQRKRGKGLQPGVRAASIQKDI